MTPERYKQIKDIFQRAIELPQEERGAYLDSACESDSEMRKEVESLLAVHEAESQVLDKPMAAVAPDLAGEPPDVIGRRIGPYRLERLLGEGGMGAVYEATRADDQFQQRVALKLVKGGTYSPEALRRFRQERQILAGLVHPHIARLLDGGVTPEGQPYFVMEYVDGKPIDQYCAEKGLGIRARLDLFRDVCAAVQYAHQNLIVHRDLKPGNILVTSEGEVKLLDFGIAKLLGEPGEETETQTRTGMHVMTPEYASPEQVRGENVTTATDVYSLGVVLYELLTGVRPFRIKERVLAEIARIICEEEPTKPSTAVTQVKDGSTIAGAGPVRPRRELAGDLDNIVLLALRKEPSRRYSSVEALSEDIRRHVDGEPVTAHPATFSYRCKKFVRRYRIQVVASALFALAIMTGMVTTLWQAHVAQRERARAERRFQDVRKLAGSMVFELCDAVTPLPGSTKARELIVKRGLQYLDSLAGESAGDVGLQLELAGAYTQIGNVQFNLHYANLGDRPGALSSQQKALNIRKALFDADPKNVDAKIGLATSYLYVGDLATTDQKLDVALADYRKSLAMRQELIAAHPKDSRLRLAAIETLVKIGDTLYSPDPQMPNLGDPKAGSEILEKAQQQMEELLVEQPQNKDARLGLPIVFERLAKIKAAQSDFAGSLEMHRKELAVLEEMARQEPNNAYLRRSVATAQYDLANALCASGDFPTALASYEKALATHESLAARDPQDVRAHNDTMITLVRMVPAAAKAGRGSEARRYVEKLISSCRSWTQRPNATADDWTNCAAVMLSIEPAEYVQPSVALATANRAVALNGRRDPVSLSALAEALFITGASSQAVQTAREALALTGDRAAIRRQVEAQLKRYEKGTK